MCRDRGIPDHGTRLRAAGYLTATETAARLGVTVPTITKWQRAGLLDGRRIDGRGTCLFPPGQTRPVTGTARIARDRAAAGLLSARQLGAQLGVATGTITRWHHLGLIDAAGHDHRGHPLYRRGQPRPTREQVAAAGRPDACRDEELLTGGQLAARLGVVRSTVYKWHRLGLIDASPPTTAAVTSTGPASNPPAPGRSPLRGPPQPPAHQPGKRREHENVRPRCNDHSRARTSRNRITSRPRQPERTERSSMKPTRS